MAARGVSPFGFDPDSFDMDKLPTNTLKRNPKNVDLNKTELLKLLGYLEGELQGRDVSIAALKAEKAKQLMYQAKYGRFGLGDPFLALQRDSDTQQDNSFDESAVKAMYDNQLMQLENLIETQRKAQMRMREQLAAVEKRYHKVCAELDEEKRRHARDAEEGDNVTCMLEKERERLKQELEFEKAQSKKLEKELKKTNVSTESEKDVADKHKFIAVELIKERNRVIEKLLVLHQRNKQLELILKDEQDKTKEMAEGLAQKGQQSHQLEASLEKTLSDFDTEREQLKLKLSREENKNRELVIEVEKLKFQIEQLQRQLGEEHRVDGPKTIEIKSSLGNRINSVSSPIANKSERTASGTTTTASTTSPRSAQVGQTKMFKNTSPQSGTSSEMRTIPVVHVRNSPDGREIATTVKPKPQTESGTSVKRALMKTFEGTVAPLMERSNKIDQLNDRTSFVVTGAKPIPAEKPAELQGTKVTPPTPPPPSSGSSVLSMTSGTTVFTTPSGTRISLNVGPSNAVVSSSSSPTPTPRKSLSALASSVPVGVNAGGGDSNSVGSSKGTPPPVPPNKPQVFLPTSNPSSFSSPRKVETLGIIRPLSPQPISPSVTGSVPIPVQHQTGKMSPRFANLPFATTGSISPRGGGGHQREVNVRKPPPQKDLEEQVVPPANTVSVEFKNNQQRPNNDNNTTQPSKPQPPPPPPRTSSSVSTTLEFLGPEIDDLQQMLVSMATEVDMSSPSTSIDTTATMGMMAQNPTTITMNVNSTPLSTSTSKRSPRSENHLDTTDPNIPGTEDSDIMYHKPVISMQPMLSESRQILQNFIMESDWFSLQEYLNHHSEVDVNEEIDNGSTIGHFVAERGQLDCLRLVINRGANINQQNDDGFSVLHSAVAGAQLGCCKVLLEYGANLEIKNKEQLNVFHLAAKFGATVIFELLVEHCVNNSPELLSKVLEETDMAGNNVVFLTAMQNNSDMLEIIAKHCDIDINVPNYNGKTVKDVASFACRALLQKQEQTKISCSVVVDSSASNQQDLTLQQQQQQQQPQSSMYIIGYISVSIDTSWPQIEGLLSDILLNNFSNVYNGLRSKKTLVKTEAESPTDSQAAHVSMGLSFNSVKYFGIGIYFWSPGTPSERRPFDLLHNSQVKQISVRLFGHDDACMDNFAYDSLIPHPQLHNYLRLMEQYGNVILYGPTGSGKTFVCRRLTQILQAKEVQMGRISEINFVAIHDRFTKTDLHSLLFQTGCLLHSTKPMAQNYTSILVLDGLEKTNIGDLFSEIEPLLTSRGPKTTVNLAFDNKGQQSYYLHNKCFILGTMDRTRLPVLDMSLQQCFRWVQFRNDQEPMKCLLHRHFYRHLLHQYSGTIPGADDPVFKAVEWVICVWQRLNEGLLKLGLQDHTLGPATFLSCPVEVAKPKGILRWLNILWNQRIAPAVSKAVVQGSGKEASVEGQHKVANTALYVLMQRSIVSGCPLTGQEKDRYLNSFQGSNELDIKIRRDRTSKSNNVPQYPTDLQNTNVKVNSTLLEATNLQNLPQDTCTVNMDLSPEAPFGYEDPAINNINNISNKGNFSPGRNPLQKSASLGSNTMMINSCNIMSVAPSPNPSPRKPGAVGNMYNTMDGSVHSSGENSIQGFISGNTGKSTETSNTKSFGSSMFALSGIPTAVKTQQLNDIANVRNVRSHSLSSNALAGQVTVAGNIPPSPQYSRALLAGSPLPQSGNDIMLPVANRVIGTNPRAGSQSPLPAFKPSQGIPLQPPTNVQLSTPAATNYNSNIESFNNTGAVITNGNTNRNIPVPMRQGLVNKPALPAVPGINSNAISSRLPGGGSEFSPSLLSSSQQNILVGQGLYNSTFPQVASASKFIQGSMSNSNTSTTSANAVLLSNTFIQRQTMINSKAGVTTVQAYSQSNTDTSSLRRAFSPTPQQISGRSDMQRPDILRRSFSPSPDMIFHRRDDKGAIPFSLPKN